MCFLGESKSQCNRADGVFQEQCFGGTRDHGHLGEGRDDPGQMNWGMWTLL